MASQPHLTKSQLSLLCRQTDTPILGHPCVLVRIGGMHGTTKASPSNPQTRSRSVFSNLRMFSLSLAFMSERVFPEHAVNVNNLIYRETCSVPGGSVGHFACTTPTVTTEETRVNFCSSCWYLILYCTSCLFVFRIC